MRSLFSKLWKDDSGALLSFEWILLATILVLAMVVGLKTVQQAILQEFEELAGAIGAISQTYSYAGATGCCANVVGAVYTDTSRNAYPITICVEPLPTTPTNCVE